MEKPHYKQPITADNIETALQFYFAKSEYNYRINDIALRSMTEHILNDREEIKNMHDIEAVLHNDLALVVEVLIKSDRVNIHTQTSILSYILAANFPRWERDFFKKHGNRPKILQRIKDAKNTIIAPIIHQEKPV
jgi:hypothetical protein